MFGDSRRTSKISLTFASLNQRNCSYARRNSRSFQYSQRPWRLMFVTYEVGVPGVADDIFVLLNQDLQFLSCFLLKPVEVASITAGSSQNFASPSALLM